MNVINMRPVEPASADPTRPRPARTVDEHLAVILPLADHYRRATERVGLNEAIGRVLAAPVQATWDRPQSTQSTIDGFAVRQQDLGDRPLPVSARILAGDSPQPLADGTAARIMSGATLPAGADTVIAFDDSKFSDDWMWPSEPAELGQNVLRAGEDARQGEQVLAGGIHLDSRHLGAVAALGLTELPVVARPRVAIITTGDELAKPGELPHPGQVADSNGPYLMAALTQTGARLAGWLRCPDKAEAFEQAMAQMSQVASADLILVTGGASTGDNDLARKVLERSGCLFADVAMQPGRAQGAGLWHGRTPVLSLPGDPVSLAISFSVFVRPLLHAMTAVGDPTPQWAVATSSWSSLPGLRQFYPVTVSTGPDGGRSATLAGPSSHLVTALAQANAFAVVAEEVTEVNPGDVLDLLPLV